MADLMPMRSWSASSSMWWPSPVMVLWRAATGMPWWAPVGLSTSAWWPNLWSARWPSWPWGWPWGSPSQFSASKWSCYWASGTTGLSTWSSEVEFGGFLMMSCWPGCHFICLQQYFPKTRCFMENGLVMRAK